MYWVTNHSTYFSKQYQGAEENTAAATFTVSNSPMEDLAP